MKIRGIVLVLSGVLMIGGVTGLVYANNEKDDLIKNKIRIESKLDKKEKNKITNEDDCDDVVNDFESNSYKSMNEFMNNMTEEDYKKMIDVIRKNGYESMADMMESMDREDMIKMHNYMGSSESCHDDNDRTVSF